MARPTIRWDVLQPGDKIHVVEKRAFEGDVRRHFIGEVERANDVAALVRGRVFVYDSGATAYRRHEEERRRIVSLTDGRLVINLLPADADVDAAEYVERAHRLVVTDGSSFTLNINEFGSRR